MISIKLYNDLNLKKLQFLGSGTQGKVFKIDSEKCIKIFKRKQICVDEIESLVMAQKDPHFPKLYSFGEDYIIREFVNGNELDKYLRVHPLTENISSKILELYEAMNLVGYTRLDAAPFHIFFTSSNNIKLIDTARMMKKRTIYPHLIIDSLKRLGYQKQFLDYVKTNKTELYAKWAKYCK